MRSLRRFMPALILLAVPGLASCGGDDDAEDSPPTSSSPESPEMVTETSSDPTTETTTTTDAGGALPAPCEVLTAQDVEAAFGVPFGDPTPGTGSTTEQDLAWQSENCNFEAEDLVEVQLALTGPDDFTQGDFTCPEPTTILSTVEPVADLGQSAWWERDDAPPLEATLRVCTEGYNFDIELEYEDGVDFQGDPKEQSISLAETVLEKVGS